MMNRKRPYQFWMPINLAYVESMGKETLLQDLQDSHCRRICFVYPTGWGKYPEVDERNLPLLKDTVKWFRSHGMEEVGVWLNDFWGSGITEGVQNMVSADGKNFDPICPLDEGYRKQYDAHLVKLAGCGVDFILLDDDYRLTFQMDHAQNFGCTCPLHQKRIGEIVGRGILREELQKALLTGGKNDLRSAWLQANKEGMENFARDARAALDSAGFENVRMGACTCPGNWDLDGTDPVTLAKLLAGKNRPLFRYSGACYWAEHHSFGGFWLQDVIEFNRMQAAWFASDNWDNFYEEDSFPRPRHNVPASFVECMDTALVADGNGGGCLKYDFDYIAKPSYEHGYVSRHVKNLPFYADLEKTFAPKENDGVRIYESMKKYGEMEIPKSMEGNTNVQNIVFSYASRLLAQAGIPTTFEGRGCVGVCFGENARELPLDALEGGMVIDACAAKLLMERGVDVGIDRFTGEKMQYLEIFPDYDLTIRHFNGSFSVHTAELKSVSVRSYAITRRPNGEPTDKIPLTYTYENQNGQRFLVYLWDGTYADPRSTRYYTRGKQLADLVPWLTKGKRKLPAYVYGNPDFYVMAKTDEKSLSVGLWNLFADETEELTVELEKSYQSIRFLRGNGRLEGDKVIVEPMAAYSIVAFEVQ